MALVNNCRTMNQENPLGKCDVLSDLSLPWNWSHLANLKEKRSISTCKLEIRGPSMQVFNKKRTKRDI